MSEVPIRVDPARGLFAIAAASLAVLSFAYGEFAPSVPSLPDWVPEQKIVVHLFALLLVVASVGLCFSRTASPSALTICTYLAIWAAIDTSPIFSQPLSLGAWYGFCEAMTSLAGAWILYIDFRWQKKTSNMPIISKRTVLVAQVLFGLTCIFYGSSHFVYANYTASMVPYWAPNHLGTAYVTGAGHIAAGIALTIGILPRLAVTLEAIMMSLFGLLVWAPSFFTQPRPVWATSPQGQWSEVVVNLLLVAAACNVAWSLRYRPWGFESRSHVSY